MDNNGFYCYGDLPQPPGWLIADVIKSAELGHRFNRNLQFRQRPANTDEDFKVFQETQHEFSISDKTYSRASYRRYGLSEASEQWVKENIGEFGECSCQLMRDGTAFLPHTDGGPRRYIINYLIKTGGDNVATQFFIEHGKDLIRDGVPLHVNNSDQLDLVESVIAPEKSWMIMFGKVIHAVAGLESPRIQLSIALSAEEFLKVKERFNLTLKYYG